jgi:hypothetical protein
MAKLLTKDEKINVLKEMFAHKNIFRGYRNKNDEDIVSYIDISKLEDCDPNSIDKMVNIYFKNDKNPGKFNPEEVLFLNEEFYKKIRKFNENMPFFAKLFVKFAYNFFDGHIQRDYESYYEKKEMEKKEYLNDIKEMTKKLEETKLNYIKKYGTNSFKELVKDEKPKINQIKIIDMMGKPVDGEYDNIYQYEKKNIQNVVYDVVKYNNNYYLPINKSIKDICPEEYLNALLNTFENKKDYIHVKIGKNKNKTKVLTKRGLLKIVIYMNDKSINDENVNIKINHLIELSNLLTHSCN